MQAPVVAHSFAPTQSLAGSSTSIIERTFALLLALLMHCCSWYQKKARFAENNLGGCHPRNGARGAPLRNTKDNMSNASHPVQVRHGIACRASPPPYSPGPSLPPCRHRRLRPRRHPCGLAAPPLTPLPSCAPTRSDTPSLATPAPSQSVHRAVAVEPQPPSRRWPPSSEGWTARRRTPVRPTCSFRLRPADRAPTAVAEGDRRHRSQRGGRRGVTPPAFRS